MILANDEFHHTGCIIFKLCLFENVLAVFWWFYVFVENYRSLCLSLDGGQIDNSVRKHGGCFVCFVNFFFLLLLYEIAKWKVLNDRSISCVLFCVVCNFQKSLMNVGMNHTMIMCVNVCRFRTLSW